jgi:transcriptional regulator with XRE-family HTH domain
MGEAAETVGERLRRLRTERGLSQKEIAAPGVGSAYISRIEEGERNPSLRALRLLAEKLGVTLEHLETYDHGPNGHGVLAPMVASSE